MNKDLHTGSEHAGPCPQADACVNVSYLRYGGISQHTLDVLFFQRIERPADHSADAEDKQHVGYTGGENLFRAEDPVKDFDQQDDVALDHKTGENTARGSRSAAVSIRQPGTERPEGAFQCHPDREEADRHRKRESVIPGGKQFLNSGSHRLHQEMACDAVKNNNAQQKQPRSEQAHDHIPCGSDKRSAAFILEHNERTGSDGVDFGKDISRKQVIGEDECLD